MNTTDFSNIKLVSSLDENISIVKTIFLNDITIIYRELAIGHSVSTRCMLVYINGMANSQLINENIIKPILLSEVSHINHSLMDTLIQKVLLTGDNKKSSNMNDIVNGIIYGKTILFLDGFSEVISIDTIGWQTREISEPQSETIIRGPREGFTESMNLNLSLLRRRLINPNLKLKFLTMGRQTKTQICVCYIEGIAEELILEELMKRLNNIDIDSILDSGYIE